MIRRLKGWRGRVALLAVGALALMGCGENGGGDGVLPGVEALVFVQRAFVQGDGSHNISGGTRQVIDYQRYVPGGGVYVLQPPTPDGELRELTETFEGVDVNGLDLSFDATQVVFSMRHGGDNRYHIFSANVDGSGDVRQLTFGDYNDIMPVFLPGDRVAFVTAQPYTAMGTRADEYEHRREVTQIATISLMAGDADRRLCAQNLSHTSAPFLMSDGTIGFSRWEHLGSVNDVKLFHMNPDCTNMTAMAGQFNKPFNSLVQATEIEPGVFVSIGTSRSGSIQAGALVRVDARSQTSDDPNLYIDVQQATFRNLTPAVPTGSDSPPSGVGRYRNPHTLPGHDELLVSWANGDVNDRNALAGTAPNFGIYMWDAATQRRTLVFDNPNTWDLYGIPVSPRDEPPVITPVVDADADPNTPAILGSVDVTVTSLNESVSGAQFAGMPLGEALGQATRMRIIEGFSSEIGGVRRFGLTNHEGAAIVGETPIYEDGSWRAAVPAFIPYHLQPLDRFGLAIRNQMLWIQAMPGETRTCGGCHASRSQTVQPRMGLTTLAQQAGADMSTFVQIPDRTELPWAGAASRRNIQDVFNENCTQCHGSEATQTDPYAGRSYTVTMETDEGVEVSYTIPYLDLSSRPLEVEYMNETVDYPASYVTLMYTSAMTGDSVALGDVPPEWVVPGSARRSRLIEVLNMTAEGDSSELAWADRALHPEDVGVTLSREDRMMLIQMADLGAQYYSRFNIEGSEWSSVREY